jgi:glutathione S-transferase
MKLYHIPGSRSCRVRWLLEELGLDYELETLALGDGSLKSPAYLAKNPLGLVPTLDDGDVTLYESGAIVQYVLERYGEGRLEPAIGDALRPIYLQWFHWAEATLMAPLAQIMRLRFFSGGEPSEAALATARKQLVRVLEVLAAEVEGQECVLGGDFSAADIMMAYGLFLARMVGELPDEPKAVRAYLERMDTRPAFARAFASAESA